MDACRCDDGPVSRVPQNAAHSGDLGGNLDVDGDNVESGPRPEGGEEFLGGDLQPSTAFAEQHGDFEQRDGAQRQWFASPDRAAEHAQLFPREPLGIDQPADKYVSVKQKARRQTVVLIPGGELPTTPIYRRSAVAPKCAPFRPTGPRGISIAAAF